MNINTSTLLNMLAPKLTVATKTTIENLSKSGKVDVTTLLKDTNIKTLLNDLVKDLTTGVKTKETVSQLLQNSKPLFELKNLSNDIKDILKHIQSDPKLEKQTSVLKQFQVDIKNINDKVLKENISNSGVFLESKLSNNPISKVLPYNVKVALTQIQTQEMNITETTKNIKTILSNLLTQNKTTNLKELTSNLTNLSKMVESNPNLVKQSAVIKETIAKLTVLTPNLNQTLKADILATLKLPLNEIGENSKQTNINIQNLSSAKSKDIPKTLQILLNQIQNNPIMEKQITIIKDFLANSNILEQKPLTTATKVQGDIKAVLLQVQEQLNAKGVDIPKEIKAQVDKVLAQIEFYQISSYSSNSNYMYLPVEWDDMEEASIKFNSTQKDNYSCHIGLTLRNHGDIKAMLLLDNNNNLSINLNVMDKEFKSKLQKNMQLLRQGINKIGLSLHNLNVFDMQDIKQQTYEQKAYTNNENLNFGIDLKV